MMMMVVYNLVKGRGKKKNWKKAVRLTAWVDPRFCFGSQGADIGTINQAGPPRFLDFVLRSSFSQEILRMTD